MSETDRKDALSEAIHTITFEGKPLDKLTRPEIREALFTINNAMHLAATKLELTTETGVPEERQKDNNSIATLANGFQRLIFYILEKRAKPANISNPLETSKPRKIISRNSRYTFQIEGREVQIQGDVPRRVTEELLKHTRANPITGGELAQEVNKAFGLSGKLETIALNKIAVIIEKLKEKFATSGITVVIEKTEETPRKGRPVIAQHRYYIEI